MQAQSPKNTTAKTLKDIVVYVLLFLAGDLGSVLLFDMLFRVVAMPIRELYYIIRACGCLALTYLLFYVYTTKILHQRMKDFRIDAAIKKWGLFFAVALPTFVVACFLAIGKTSVNRFSSDVNLWIILSSLLTALKAGILEEVLFRGYIMKLLENRWNTYVAVPVPSVLFSFAHIPAMESFSVGGVVLLIVSGTLVGVMFSLVAYRGNSIGNSILLHTVWNFVFVTDMLHITIMDGAYGEPIFSVIIPSDNILLTGAGFGAEASVIAIVGYLLVCCAVILWKNDKLVMHFTSSEESCAQVQDSSSPSASE